MLNKKKNNNNNNNNFKIYQKKSLIIFLKTFKIIKMKVMMKIKNNKKIK